MYFPDLTPYRYTGCDGNFLNIGWLERGQAFPVGKCPASFVEQLFQLCRHPVTLCRGFHSCDLCSPVERDMLVIHQSGTNLWLGSGEVEAAGADGTRYRAPTLIYHYVTEHGYLPPQEFIEAVLQSKAIS